MTPIIVFDHVSKRYRRYHSESLRQTLQGLYSRVRTGESGKAGQDDYLWAVKDLSFEVVPGSTVGLIGPNGAGKTTVLKLLSRITRPSQGSIRCRGRVSALIELGAGFHPDLTGRENVFLNGTILGMRRREIQQRFDEIVEFAGLIDFIDTPIKYYSSGMYARLGFAVAAFVRPDVLLVDEVLAVGDASFQQRCYQHMQRLQDEGTAVLLVSHNLRAIAEICSTTIVLNRGTAVFQGPTSQAVAEYANLVSASVVCKEDIPMSQDGIIAKLRTHGAQIVHVHIVDQTGTDVSLVKPGDWVKVVSTIEFHEDAPSPIFACFVRDEQGRLIYDQTTLWSGVEVPSFRRGQRVQAVYDLQMNVVEGIYQIGVDLAYRDLKCYYDRLESAARLVVGQGTRAQGIADLQCRFQFG